MDGWCLVLGKEFMWLNIVYGHVRGKLWGHFCYPSLLYIDRKNSDYTISCLFFLVTVDKCAQDPCWENTKWGLVMRCPFCGNIDTQVKDSRPAEDHVSIRRRRFCVACGGRFTTYERVQAYSTSIIYKATLATIMKAINRSMTGGNLPYSSLTLKLKVPAGMIIEKKSGLVCDFSSFHYHLHKLLIKIM